VLENKQLTESFDALSITFNVQAVYPYLAPSQDPWKHCKVPELGYEYIAMQFAGRAGGIVPQCENRLDTTNCAEAIVTQSNNGNNFTKLIEDTIGSHKHHERVNEL
jgi:hypothetical protein